MKYHVTVEWSGYSRGYKVLSVEAKSKEDALESIKDFEWDDEVSRGVVRDDTDTNLADVTIDDVEEA